jgi:hypothetical protein
MKFNPPVCLQIIQVSQSINGKFPRKTSKLSYACWLNVQHTLLTIMKATPSIATSVFIVFVGPLHDISGTEQVIEAKF